MLYEQVYGLNYIDFLISVIIFRNEVCLNLTLTMNHHCKNKIYTTNILKYISQNTFNLNWRMSQ